jgi:hypothetical protein
MSLTRKLKAALNENAILRAALFDIAATKPGARTVVKGKPFNPARTALVVLRFVGAEVPDA